MYALLLVALLLALLFDTAAAASSPIDPILSAAPMEFPYPDPEHMLDAICGLCNFSMGFCLHSGINSFTQSTFLSHPEWPRDASSVFSDVERNLSDPTGLFTAFGSESAPSIDSGVSFVQDISPSPSSFAGEMERNPSGPIDSSVDSDFPTHYLAGYTEWPAVAGADRQPLKDACVQIFNRETETTVKPSTVQYHVEDTYNPGDRIEQAESRARRASNKRQAPRPGGFPCPYQGCAKMFDRNCDVNRHVKTHLDRSKRPHRCPECDEGFLYPKDLVRHKKKHTLMQGTLFCNVPGCSSEGFSRRDNLLRHQRRQHPTAPATS